MLDMKAAFEILGVREGATRDEIVKRYNIVLKKHRMGKTEESGVAIIDSKSEMEVINQAYNLLMGYVTEDESEKLTVTAPNILLKKLGIDQKKAGNFFYYYKFHMLIGLAVLLIATFTVKGFTTRVTPDLNVVFIGAFSYSDNEIIQKKIKDGLPGLRAVSVDIIPVFKNDNSQQDYAFRMKAITVLEAGVTDVYIFDKSMFLEYGKRGVVKSLDKMDAIDNDNRLIRFKTEDSDVMHGYGVDVSSSDIIKGSGIFGNEFIVAIGLRPEHPSRAVEFLKLLLK